MSPGYAIIEQVFEREAFMTTLAPVAVSPIKLTRRGRMLVSALSFAAMLAISLVSLFGIATASAKASNETSNSTTTQIVVAPGETLWTIAARVNPEIDPRAVIEEIKALNVIEGSEVYAGQVLLVP
jgi:multidrug efflux pump subunit AcrA (membrane-fusion protein)